MSSDRAKKREAETENIERSKSNTQHHSTSEKTRTRDQPGTQTTTPTGRVTSNQRRQRMANATAGRDEERGSSGIPIGSPDSKYEREADKIASQVAGSGHATTSSTGTTRRVQRSTKAGDASQGTAPTSVENVISSPGESLSTRVQQKMESSIGENYSGVNIHTGPRAAKSADDVNARAYTVGNDIVFNSGEYAPDTPGGQRTLAHELAHVTQQSQGDAMVQRQLREPDARSSKALKQEEKQRKEFFSKSDEEVGFDEIKQEGAEVARLEITAQLRELAEHAMGVEGKGTYIGSGSSERNRKRKEILGESHKRVSEQASQKYEQEKQRLADQVAQEGTTAAQNDKIKYEQAAQSAFKELKNTNEQAVDRILQQIANEAVEESITKNESEIQNKYDQKFAQIRPKKEGRTVRSKSQKTRHKEAAKEAAEKTAKEILNEKKIKRTLTTTLQGYDWEYIKSTVLQQVESEDIGGNALNVSAPTAGKAFWKLGRYIDATVDTDESSTTEASLTIRCVGTPVSITIKASLTAEKDDSGALEMGGTCQVGVTGELGAASVTGNVLFNMQAEGNSTEDCIRGLTYSFYRWTRSEGLLPILTEKKNQELTDVMWGSKTKGVDARVEAERWASETETKMSNDAHGMVGWGVSGSVNVGGGNAAVELSGEVSAGYTRLARYSKAKLMEQYSGSLPSTVTTREDADERVRLLARQKQGRNWIGKSNFSRAADRETANNFSVSGKFTASFNAGGGVTVGFQIKAGYNYNELDGHELTLQCYFRPPGGSMNKVGRQFIQWIVERIHRSIQKVNEQAKEQSENDQGLPDSAGGLDGQQFENYFEEAKKKRRLKAAGATGNVAQGSYQVHQEANISDSDNKFMTETDSGDMKSQEWSDSEFGSENVEKADAGDRGFSSESNYGIGIWLQRTKEPGSQAEWEGAIVETKSSSYTVETGVVKGQLSFSNAKKLRTWKRRVDSH